MRATITSTSQTLQQLLSAADYAILEWYYKQDNGGGGGIIRNIGLNRVYVETGKAAVVGDSFYMNPAVPADEFEGDVLSVWFRGGALATQFKTESGTSDILILF